MTFSSKFRATGTGEVALRQVLGLRDTERKFIIQIETWLEIPYT